MHRLKRLLGKNLKYAVWAEETHADARPVDRDLPLDAGMEETGQHLHCLFLCHRRASLTMESLDGLAGKHGKPNSGFYVNPVDVPACIRYVKKDNNWIEFGDPQGATVKASEAIWTLVKEGATYDQITEEYGGYCLMHGRAVRDAIAIQRQKLDRIAEGAKLAWVPPDPDYVDDEGGQDWSNPAWRLAIVWCIQNLFIKRKHKQKQLWLHGAHDVGKTTFIMWLERFCRIYRLPLTDHWYGYDDNDYDLLIADEFNGHQHQITSMNLILEGSKLVLNVKGAQAIKRKNHPIIVCTNRTPEECYPKVHPVTLEAFKSRFTIVNVTERCGYLSQFVDQ